MRNFLFLLLLSVMIGCATTNPNLGRPAPQFSLIDLSDHLVKSDDFKGKNLVLVFYVSYT